MSDIQSIRQPVQDARELAMDGAKQGTYDSDRHKFYDIVGRLGQIADELRKLAAKQDK